MTLDIAYAVGLASLSLRFQELLYNYYQEALKERLDPISRLLFIMIKYLDYKERLDPRRTSRPS